MSDVNVPVTDAFSGGTSLESLEVELTPKQIEWLRAEAAERDLSVDHVLRSLITDQIRARGEDPSPTTPPTGSDSSDSASEETTDDSSPSIVDSLRSANERLQELTDDDNTADRTADERSQAPPPPNRPADGGDDASVMMDDGPSMFDLMEEKTSDE